MRISLSLLSVALLFGAASCRKDPTSGPGQKRTSISGQLVRKYSRTPVPGTIMSIRGERDVESCIFCPKTTSDQLGFTLTDSNGYFSFTIDTADIYTAMTIGNFVYHYPIRVGADNRNVTVDAYESIILRQRFRVVNNTRKPLFITGPSQFTTIQFYGTDTTFTTYNIAQPNEREGNWAYYTDSSGGNRSLYLPYSTAGFVDTLDQDFEIDAATF